MIGVRQVEVHGRLTRKNFLCALGGGAAWLALSSVAGCGSDEQAPEQEAGSETETRPQARNFASRPDLRPPAIEVTKSARDVAPGYVFVVPDRGPGQYGPLILDDQGEPVWFRHAKDRLVRDFRAQSYRGRPVLTWWEGEVVGTRGIGEYVILDDSYREIARFEAGNGYEGDLHEFRITPRDTALITAYHRVRADLSSVGESRNGKVLEGVAQELDLESGEVLFEWRSLGHVGLEESYVGPPENPGTDYDYFHINSVEVDHDGNFLVSARNTWAVYKIERDSGEVLWRLGGKKSDFEMEPGTETAYQHDARRREDGTVTIFDNGAAPEVHDESRGLVLDLDEAEMSATLSAEYTHPREKLLAGFLGNMQTLPNGNVFVGWGSEPYFSEFGPDGELLFDARLPPEYTSYRSYRLRWEGRPAGRPAAVAKRGSGDEVTLYASWNGATEVAEWEALAGPATDRMKPVTSVPRDGFETGIPVDDEGPYFAARARDGSGQVLGTSETVRTE